MKLTLFLCTLALVLALVYTTKPTGVIEKMYTKEGLDNHYRSIFSKANSTYGQHSLGTASDSKGWWIFGTAVSITKSYLDNYSLGDVGTINYSDMTYRFTSTSISGTFKYKWTYRWYFIPFHHTSECTMTLGTHDIVQKYVNKDGKFGVDRSIDYTSGNPVFDCSDGDQKQKTSWGHDWLVEVRTKYFNEALPTFLSSAIDEWLDSVDDIYTIVSSATMDKLTFTLGETLNQVVPDDNANLVLGYNYTMKYNSKSVTPEPHEDITGHDGGRDLVVYFYEEFFDSLVTLDRQTIPFVGIINDKSLPAGIEFRMKAKDFRYIIDGMQSFSPDSDMEADCGYSSGNSTFAISDSFVSISLPISCKLDCGAKHLVDATFDLYAQGQASIQNDGTLSIINLTYDVLNFNAVSPTQQKILSEYLVRRIISYTTLSQSLSNIQYLDQRFNGMINLSVQASPQVLKVSADFP